MSFNFLSLLATGSDLDLLLAPTSRQNIIDRTLNLQLATTMAKLQTRCWVSQLNCSQFSITMYNNRPLYGGAITCDIKSDWRDVSDIRQVPDHQECYQELEGAVLVVEILERQQISDADAAAYFFNDLAESNGSTENQFTPKSIPPGTNPVNINNGVVLCGGIGVQTVAMGRDHDIAGNPRQQEVRLVQVELCVFRLANVGTDLLVTISKPINNASEMDSNGSEPFQKAISSLQIKDWGLFG